MRAFIFLLASLFAAPAFAQQCPVLFVHDVRDRPQRADEAGSAQLLGALDWLAAHDWRVLAADAPCAANGVVLAIGANAGGLYSRAFPLALAYRVPLTAIGDANAIDAAQAREMRDSGLVGFMPATRFEQARNNHALVELKRDDALGDTVNALRKMQAAREATP